MAVSKDKQLEHLIAENERLKNQSRLLSAILDNAPILISAKDLEGNILFTNKHFAVLDGPSPEEYINQSVFELFPKDIAEQLWQNDLKAQRSAEPIQAEETVQHRDGKAHVYHTTKFRLLDASESLIGTCAVSFDISRKKQLEQEVLHDFLTGIYNQRYIEENFSRDLARAQRLNKELMVAFIDIDDFKQVNDRFGHDKGNQILKAVAETLQSQMHRPDDVAFRFGGDEFGILLLAEDKEISVKLVERLHRKINEAIASLLENSEVTCSASIGVKFVRPFEKIVNFRSLYLQVDKALYEAKQQGKNSIVFY